MSEKLKYQAPCPTCGKPVTWEPASTYKPFCSERCRLIDLGEWLNESNRISEPTDEHPSQQTGFGEII